MSNNLSFEDAKRMLDELEKRIQAARNQYGAVPEADKDWQDMVRGHRDVQRKLLATKDRSSESLETMEFDIDILRNSFEKWMSKVERKFAQDTRR
jgi:polyhydroxyalkanoate synthesis regulator phasin